MSKIDRRTAGWLGITVVVLLFLSARMVTLPSSAQGTEVIVAFYATYRWLILFAQAVGLIAVSLFIAFALGLEDTTKTDTHTRYTSFLNDTGSNGLCC